MIKKTDRFKQDFEIYFARNENIFLLLRELKRYLPESSLNGIELGMRSNALLLNASSTESEKKEIENA